MSKILFITTTNLASNPRLLKELLIAENIFNYIEVIQFRLGNWSDVNTDTLKLSLKNTVFTELSAIRKPFLPWLHFSLLELILNKMYFGFFGLQLTAFSLNKRSILLYFYLKKKKTDYDWIIAHNPGAFYPAYHLSKRTGSKLGFDIEDYHPGETNNLKKSIRMSKLMNCLLPQANYCSFAAPLIQKEVEKGILKKHEDWFTIINGFSKSEFRKPTTTQNNKLKLVWFSQNITPGRGLEKYISVANSLHKDIELHLIGELSDQNKRYLFKNCQGIFIYRPMPQKELHQLLGDFDIGLAVEPCKDLNNSIAISNKIIAYAQAGLFVLATPTPGQLGFLQQSNLNYEIVVDNDIDINRALQNILLNKTKYLNKLRQYKIADKYSWENISEPIKKVWKN